MKNFSEQELKEYAQEHAKTIVIRSYERGNSKDERRDSTEQEQEILTAIIYGALLAATNSGITTKEQKTARIDGIINMAEYTGNILMKNIVYDGEMNGYDSIYCPLREWEKINIK